jgi:tripartite-type tricarboxylate transporter receptor subunit TctC
MSNADPRSRSMPRPDRVRRLVAGTLCLALLGASGGSALAESYPAKPVHLIVPFPPGGSLDISGRLVAQHLQEIWKQPIVVENKPGSTIGPETVVKSPPDGYTLLVISSTPLVTLPQLQKVPYDVLKDLTGVTETVRLNYAMVASTGSGIQSLQDLVAKAKAAPGRLNYSSAGNGSGQHLLMELFKSAANVDLTHVPYKGSAAALQAVLANEVPIMLDVTVATAPIVQSGKVRALMVTGARPLEQFPGSVPFDRVYPGFGIENWHGFFAPAGTPGPVLDRIAQDVQTVLREPSVADRFRQLGVEPSGVSGDAFNAIVRRDYERWGELIRKNGLRSD